jgi:hypothetical protein
MAIEFHFTPRAYQEPIIQYMLNGGMAKKRAVLVWHRRAGKDITALNILLTAAIYDRVGTYFYLFPTYGQGKKIIWDGMDDKGRKFLSYIPKELIALDKSNKPKINETDMQVELVNGSIIQIIGTDRIDSVVGTNPVGCVFSEYAIQKPIAWKLIEPILAANKGWALFVYTPRGHNHGYDLYEGAGIEGWFRQLLTVEQTQNEAGEPIIDQAYIDSLRRRGTDEGIINQEYYCSFTGSIEGAYYGHLMKLAHAEHRIGDFPWEPRFPVETWWDLGRNDANVIWFVQHIGRRPRAIDLYYNRQQGLAHYIKVVREKDYTYDKHVLPHDINVTEYSSNVKRIDVARSLGLSHITVAPKLHITEGIEAVRLLLPRMEFNDKKCLKGIQALEEYHKEYDDEKKCYAETPVHDWASNFADAVRTGAVVEKSGRPPLAQTHADSAYNPLGVYQSSADSDFSVYGV